MKPLILLISLIASIHLQAKPNKHDKTLDAFLTESWEYSLSRSPQSASYYGDKEQAGQLDNVSADHKIETAVGYQKLLDKLNKINRDKLSTENKINF